VDLKAGARLRAAADTTEVIVVRAPAGVVDLRCGGHPMLAAGDADHGQLPVDPEFAGGTQLGKRYVDDAIGLEVLCTKRGDGSLAVGRAVLAIKAAKPLPSSD
jgi:hypothetical protein